MPLVRILRTAIVTLAIGYLGVIGVLLYLENRFVYHPTPAKVHWQSAPSHEIEDVSLRSADGTKIGAWWLPCPSSERTLLYLHGNAGNLSHRGHSIVKLRSKLDASVLIIDYPGYGKSEGIASEAGCYLAADAAYDHLVGERGRDPKQLVLYGGSLGGAVAIELASRRPHRAACVVKAFTSAPAVGGRWFPWIPVHLMMRNRFANIDKIGKLQTPIFIAHGDRDTVVPYDHGEALFAAANEPKEFLRLPGQDHNDPLPDEFFTRLRKFIDEH